MRDAGSEEVWVSNTMSGTGSEKVRMSNITP